VNQLGVTMCVDVGKRLKVDRLSGVDELTESRNPGDSIGWARRGRWSGFPGAHLLQDRF
jgi:hypothetical protein